MTAPLQQSRLLNRFHCLGDMCEDTCCKGWGMQLSQQTVDLYKQKAPDLLSAVTSGEAEHIMKRDPDTDYCVKFEAGWCGIHRQYGTAFLGDACHFFPRATRALGHTNVMTASLSCPEVVRLGLLEENGFTLTQTETDRLPHSLKQYLPEHLEENKALDIHQAFLHVAGDEAHAPEYNFARISSVARALQMVSVDTWGIAHSFYFKNVETRLPLPEINPADPFNLLNALQGLLGAAKKTSRPRLDRTISEMEQMLHVTLNWEHLTIALGDDSAQAYQAMRERWQREWAEGFAPVLRRYLQGQIAIALFPFAGLGETLTDRITIIGVRYATVKLALMCACMLQGRRIPDVDIVRVVQSVSRFMDHLADPTFSIRIYQETGWTREPRLRALVQG